MATATEATAPAQTPRRGWPDLPCPKCGEAGNVSCNLADVSAFTCTSCDAEFSDDDVRQLIAEWQRVLDWLALVPALPE